MQEEIKDIKELKPKRLKLLCFILLSLFLLLILRLYIIMLAKPSGNGSQVYKPIKLYEGFDFLGDIYDINMKKLVKSGTLYEVIIHPGLVGKSLTNGDNKYINLLQIIADSNSAYLSLYNRIKNEYNGSQRAITMDVDSQVAAIVEQTSLSGIFVNYNNKKYGDQNVASSITSIFLNNTLNNGDIKYDDSTDMKIFNLITGHVDRTLKVPVDGRGSTIKGLNTVEDNKTQDAWGKGSDVQLTIDYNIQKIAEDTLNDMWEGNGAVSVIDIPTGGVAAMASKDDSGFERNMVTYGTELWGYNPGSVFKTVVLAAALEDKKVDYNTKFFCSGISSLNGIRCSKITGHGLIGLKDAFANSCNVYFIELARKVGAKRIIEMAQKFGFGSKVLNFSRESMGMLYKNEKDIYSDTGNIAIGQKDILVTPIQVCDMMATIARGGTRKKAYILSNVLNKDGSVYSKTNPVDERIISKNTSSLLQDLLKSVVESGTGKKAQLEVGAAGKTGTPQRGSKVSPGKYEHEDGWFAGYFPAGKPRYAVAVYLEDIKKYGTGENISTAIFKELAEKIIETSN